MGYRSRRYGPAAAPRWLRVDAGRLRTVNATQTELLHRCKWAALCSSAHVCAASAYYSMVPQFPTNEKPLTMTLDIDNEKPLTPARMAHTESACGRTTAEPYFKFNCFVP